MEQLTLTLELEQSSKALKRGKSARWLKCNAEASLRLVVGRSPFYHSEILRAEYSEYMLVTFGFITL